MMTIDGNRFRRARIGVFLAIVDQIKSAPDETIRVLDIGGTRNYWDALHDLWSSRKLDITIVNLGSETADDGPYHIRAGNACALPEYSDNSFDIVHSNSVIEHVGHWAEMRAMAREVRRLAPHYYLQTPNFWFPLEPHYRTLFWQMYPESWRARMLMKKRRGFRGPVADWDTAMHNIQDVNLLTAGQLSALFPDGQIERERVFGLAKSLIVRR